jgi:hypothetical protein
MSWIKRNLFFVIGGAVALVLMGLAGWFLYSNWNSNNQIKTEVSSKLDELNKLNKERPHPGVKEVNNVTNAEDQTRQLREFITKTRACFTPIAAIPSTPQVDDQGFSRGLSSTIKGLQDLAAKNSVSVPQGYCFSFEAMKTNVNFAPGSLGRVAAQLGEVKAISEILLQSRINSLTSVRRERVSADDSGGPQTDYVSGTTVTNDLAIVTPYEATFTCFSAELGAVLAALATSPYGIVVRSVDVTPAPVAENTANATPGSPPTMAADPYTVYRAAATAPAAPVASPPVRQPPAAAPGTRPGGYPMPPATTTSRGQPQPPPVATPPQPRPIYVPPSPEAPKPGPQTVLDEKLLTVNLGLNLVKLLPPK